MFVQAIDRAFREFENRTVSPEWIEKAARFFGLLMEDGFGSGEVNELQEQRINKIVGYAYQNSPFYRHLFNQERIHPGRIHTKSDLRQLPFTTPEDIRDWRNFLCVPEADLAAIFATAGSTGEPKKVVYSMKDMRMLTNFSALALRVEYPGRLWTLIALPLHHGLWMGSATAWRIVERAGGLPIPTGSQDVEEVLDWMKRLKPNVLFSSPSFMTILTDQAQQKGIRQRMDRIILGGEMLDAERRKRFEDYWQTEVLDSYGSTEIGGAQTIVLPGCKGFHLNDFHLVTEIIDPQSGDPSQEGELVFTTLTREAMPLVRYRSGDRARWVECSCGLPLSCMQLLGRLDDMIVAGDMNIYGGVLSDVIKDFSATSGRVRVELDRVDLRDRMRIQVEADDVGKEQVRKALLEEYPRIDSKELILEIETGIDLSGQIKGLEIRDHR